MPRQLRLIAESAFGTLAVRDASGEPGDDFPLWLVDRPDVLAALQVLAARGGSQHPDLLRSAFCDLIVDLDAKTVTRVEAADV